MLQHILIVVLLGVSVHCSGQSESNAAPATDTASVSAPLTSLTGLGGSYSDFQKKILASQPPDQTFTLRAGDVLPAGYGTPQVVSSSPEHQELVVQHPQPRRILVRVVKPIIFEERIVIVPYRRVTHEVRPVIEERHTVIYGKDGKQIGGHPGGYDQKGGYSEQVVKKVGQTVNKRSSVDYSGSRPNPLENRRSQRDRIVSRLNEKRAKK